MCVTNCENLNHITGSGGIARLSLISRACMVEHRIFSAMPEITFWRVARN